MKPDLGFCGSAALTRSLLLDINEKQGHLHIAPYVENTRP